MTAKQTQDSALSEWSEYVRMRAASFGLSAKDIAGRLGQKSIPMSMVTQWLDGMSAPATPELHARLMQVLKLPHTMDDIAANALSEDQQRQATFRAQIEHAYHAIPETDKTSDVGSRAAKAWEGVLPSTTVRAPGGEGLVTIHDDAALPKRLLEGNLKYSEQSADELAAMMEKTQNTHEFLSCYRVLLSHRQGIYWSQQRMGKEVGYYYNCEIGPDLPGIDTLPKFKRLFEKFTQLVPVDYQAFEDMVIANRLAIIHRKHTAGFHGNHTAGQLKEMPLRYWETVMERYNADMNGQGSQHQPVAGADWAKAVIPIENQSHYLRAARGMLELSTHDVGKACGVRPNVVKNVENGSNASSSPVGQKMAKFYEERQALMRNGQKDLPASEQKKLLFDPSVYQQLPPTTWEQDLRLSKERRARKAGDKGNDVVRGRL